MLRKALKDYNKQKMQRRRGSQAVKVSSRSPKSDSTDTSPAKQAAGRQLKSGLKAAGAGKMTVHNPLPSLASPPLAVLQEGSPGSRILQDLRRSSGCSKQPKEPAVCEQLYSSNSV